LPPRFGHGSGGFGFADGRRDWSRRDHDHGWGWGGRRGGVHFGFGFYSASLWQPSYYPAYYPVYTPPVIVESPTYVESPSYVESPGYVESPTYVAPEAAPQDYSAPQSDYGYDAAAVAPAEAVGTQASSPAPTNQLEQMINDGTQAFRGGDYTRAAQLFGQAAAADGRNADARLAYGMAQFALGDYRQAAAAIRDGIGIAPELVNTTLDLRDNYSSDQEFDKNFERLAQQVENNPNDADALLVLGFVYHFVGDRQDSRAVFEQIRTQGGSDARLANIFLNARPVPATSAPQAAE
jgi:tetratricopeptide (TPR) repeat protein